MRSIPPFVDPDPFRELRFANTVTAKPAIADYLGLPRAKLTAEDRGYIDTLLKETLDRRTVITCVRGYLSRLESKFDELLKIAPPTEAGQNLQRVIKKFRQNLLVFVTNRHIPPTNNGSEQALRPCAIFRKVTNCFRSV